VEERKGRKTSKETQRTSNRSRIKMKPRIRMRIRIRKDWNRNNSE
jgi:hypothetical protein